MKMLDEYFALQKEIFEYFGYVEDWRVIPLDDCREYWWHLTGEAHGNEVKFSAATTKTEAVYEMNNGEGYSNEIYTQRFLPKWVYRGEKYTMVCVDTHTDMNHFLSVYSNEKEIKTL